MTQQAKNNNQIAQVFASACFSSHPNDVVNAYTYMYDRISQHRLKEEEIVDGLASWAIHAVFRVCSFESKEVAKEQFLSIFNEEQKEKITSLLGKYPASDAHTLATRSILEYGARATFLASITILGRELNEILRNG